MDTSADPVVRDATSEEMVAKSTAMTASSAGFEEIICDSTPTILELSRGATTDVDPRISAAEGLDTAAENVWMCFACMLKLGVMKKRMENKDKHTCVDCEECPQGIYQLNRHECSGPCTSATRRETSIVPGVPAYSSDRAKTGCESRQSCGCTSAAHICSVDERLGCTSCHRMCHENCQDVLCEYYACVLCLSLIPSEFQFVPHEDSPECRDVQMYTYGCHACGQKQCHTKSPTCFAKCTALAHVCGDDRHTGCTSCGKRCHVNNSDARCPYFQRVRGKVTWDANESQLQDTKAGTGGSLPHQSQINWRFNGNTTSGSTSIVVDGRPYYVQYGNPGRLSEGERNNCLIDSLRQCIGVQCDRTLVRADLQSLYEFHAGRAKVTFDSYLDVEEHWKDILRSLFRHNTSGVSPNFNPDDYCVIALSKNMEAHGVVLGSRAARFRLVVLNTSDVHFDACLPL